MSAVSSSSKSSTSVRSDRSSTAGSLPGSVGPAPRRRGARRASGSHDGAMSTWTIVVAAGTGQRFGGEVPKQFLPLGGRRVLDWAVAGARAATDGVVVVVGAAADPGYGRRGRGGARWSRAIGFGACRAGGAPAGLRHRRRARRRPPPGRPRPYRAVVAAVRAGADGAIPGTAVTDTIKAVRDGVVVDTPDRDSLVAVQTPQAFRFDVLRRAHDGGGQATDDAASVEARGFGAVAAAGDPDNLKITPTVRSPPAPRPWSRAGPAWTGRLPAWRCGSVRGSTSTPSATTPGGSSCWAGSSSPTSAA